MQIKILTANIEDEVFHLNQQGYTVVSSKSEDRDFTVFCCEKIKVTAANNSKKIFKKEKTSKPRKIFKNIFCFLKNS